MKKNVEINEAAIPIDRGRLDPENKIVFNVALLRSISENGRRYSENAMQNFADLSEGKKAYLNHDDKTKPRSIRDLLGFFDSVRVDGDVIRGSLHYLETYSDLIESIVEKNPNLVGFSPHLFGDVMARDDGINEVLSVGVVESIDLVTEPATTTGLFESLREGKMKDEESLEDLEDSYAEILGVKKAKATPLTQEEEEIIGYFKQRAWEMA